ncbi:MAG TPA: hypothetical protein DCY14_15385 [Anaerolineae bacterium]|nr:hypothetical protein [Anaerolineae bacterium]
MRCPIAASAPVSPLVAADVADAPAPVAPAALTAPAPAAPTPLAASIPMETICCAALIIPPKASAVVEMVILPRIPARESNSPVAPHNQITRRMADSIPCCPIQVLAAIPALKTPPATMGSRAINTTAFIHKKRSQVA